MLALIRKNYVYVLFFISFAATAGSLFISEFMLLPPCDLCWYQRGFMYPIAVITLVAALKKDLNVYSYVAPLAIIGWGFALYHYLLQKTDWFVKLTFCSAGNPCSDSQLEFLGFITIPFMSLAAFTLLIGVCYVYWIGSRKK